MNFTYEQIQAAAEEHRIHPDIVGFLAAYRQLATEVEFDRWVKASRHLDSYGHMDPERVMMVLGVDLGVAIAIQLMEFRRIAKLLPDPKDILSGKITQLVPNLEIAMQYALVTACCYELRETEKTAGKKSKELNEQMDHFIRFLMLNCAPELVIMAAKAIIQVFRIQFDIRDVPSFEDFAFQYKHMIMA